MPAAVSHTSSAFLQVWSALPGHISDKQLVRQAAHIFQERQMMLSLFVQWLIIRKCSGEGRLSHFNPVGACVCMNVCVCVCVCVRDHKRWCHTQEA